MRAAVIGRFQPFHKGHLHMIEQFRQDHDLVVVVANEESRTEENPLTFKERTQIISDCLGVRIGTQEDHPDDDRKWANEIVEKTGAEGVISNNDRTVDAIEQNSELKIIRQEMKQPDLYSGTEVRRRIRSGEEWRYLVPDCAEEKIAELADVIRESGIQYDFEPGWKRENAYHSTAEE